MLASLFFSAGLQRKSEKIGRRKGMVVGGHFHAAFSISAAAERSGEAAEPERPSAVASTPTLCGPEPAGSPPGPSAMPLHPSRHLVGLVIPPGDPAHHQSRIAHHVLDVVRAQKIMFTGDGKFKRRNARIPSLRTVRWNTSRCSSFPACAGPC